MYNGHVIVYGLGNFYIPSGYFFDGKLSYPEQSKKMMVLELSEDSNEVLCHWFLTDEQESLRLIKTEKFVDGDIITQYSPYRKMNDREYLKFFKKNRIKRRLVPVFTNFKGFRIQLKNLWQSIELRLLRK